MCQKLLRDARFHAFLLEADREMAAEARECGCRRCASVVHVADFPRKPRGGPAGLGEEHDRRFSFCCAADGCRARRTPPSLRFLGRKVYTSTSSSSPSVSTDESLSCYPSASPIFQASPPDSLGEAVRPFAPQMRPRRGACHWRGYHRTRMPSTGTTNQADSQVSAVPDPSKHSIDPREFIRIRAGYSDIFGETTTWEDLQRDLSRYTLAEVLDVLGRVSAVLETARYDDVEIQPRLATGLFRERGAEILERAKRLGAAAGNPRVVLFEPLQLASLAKAALLLLPPNGDLRPTIDYGPLATALLRMTDLIGPGELGTFNTEEGRQAWAMYLFATGIFYRGGWDLHDLARFHILSFDRHKDLVSHADYVDLPALIETATGLTVQHFSMGLTAFQSQWISLTPDRAAVGPVFIDEQSFLASNFQFSQDEQDRIVSLACSDASVLQEACRAQYRLDAFKPYDVVPLADKPLVRIGRKIFCPSVPLLMAKLTTGLYYLLANSLSGDERDRFTRFLGAVFEKYVKGLLTRMFGSSGAIVLDGESLQTAAASSSQRRSKLVDFLLFVDGIALVIETKARFFPRGARAGQSWVQLSSRLGDIYSRGARQIEGTIELCESGALRGVGIEPAKVAAYVPLVISLDETPLTPPVYDLLTPVRPASGAQKTVPLQIVGVSELEPLEAAAAARKLNVHALLGYKASTGKQAESLRNTMSREPTLRDLSTRNPLLERVYGEAMVDALRMLQLRALR